MGGGVTARGLLEHATEVGKNTQGEEPRFSWEAPGGVDRASSGPAAHVLFPPQRLHEVWKHLTTRTISYHPGDLTRNSFVLPPPVR